ncbi:SMC family ATPase [Streptomyces sp. AM 2-1-1]|uniref:AAA family ATPase n=1 Tax=Streptomyces sp. AM 2-1-1 TaxID=3028709 RepID=UPI0023B971E4|nr:SMC family ATPase [Streptomyces sp. AM 2-1-1]WEH43021.1 SMC family ATPase [Streptomyces sp. AM 2-1-1]
MRLHRLTLTAFGPFGTTTEVDFDGLSSAGLFLLHGPTGAGKTSVLDAVCYALYGAVPGARQSPGTSLRSDHADPGTPTEVLLELTAGGRRLEITRSPAQSRPKKKGAGCTTEKAQSRLRAYDPDKGWQALSKSHQEIGEEITQLLGMSRDQFCQVVLLPQGDFARFLRADAEARGKLLGRLFDTRRFAAVEERLAELRRAAESRVRAGDERVLAIAQRLAQAAGPVAETPLPALQPGEPGLTEGVLGWAATARSGARERLEITRVAVAAAEERRGAARDALDAELERARLQQRFAETRRRASALEEGRAERDRCDERLARARKAELIVPALDVLDAAEREAAAAGADRDRVRARLPAELADASAGHLAELERRYRQELGGLDAARRAESRSTAIDAERAQLDDESAQDDETIQEAAAWLAGWDDTRTALTAEVEEAQEAATRTERLAARLAVAQNRLDAARRRDALAREIEGAREELTAVRESALLAHERWLSLRERRLGDIAAELAAGLTAGEPCAVCGSADHPAPARPGDGHVDRATEEAALASHRAAEQDRVRAEQGLVLLSQRHAAARADALGDARDGLAAPVVTDGPDAPDDTEAGRRTGSGDPSVAVLSAHVQELTREHREAHRLATGAHRARETLAAAQREHQDRLDQRRHAERRAAGRISRREALDREQAALEVELAGVREVSGSIAAHADRLARRADLLAAAADAVRVEASAAERRKEADGRLSDAAFRAGFDTPQAAVATLLDRSAQRQLQSRIDVWQAEAATVADRLAEDDAREAAGRPAAAPDRARQTYDRAETLLRDASASLAAAQERTTELDRLSREAVTETRALGPLRAEYEGVARLAALTAGTSADNERKMRLESYVLAARLEQVAAAATVRLQRMSAGRYTLVHSDARTGGRRAGLGLHVVDAWTGRERDTATLSGGETFFASLALALGLADVVTDEAGGTRLDTLFIDEGFGSLDEQTLDEVLDVLDALRERDRSVGIVSHVGDLRRRVPVQLEVVKGRRGSTVRHHLG